MLEPFFGRFFFLIFGWKCNPKWHFDIFYIFLNWPWYVFLCKTYSFLKFPIHFQFMRYLKNLYNYMSFCISYFICDFFFLNQFWFCIWLFNNLSFLQLGRALFYLLHGNLLVHETSNKANSIFKFAQINFCYLTLFKKILFTQYFFHLSFCPWILCVYLRMRGILTVFHIVTFYNFSSPRLYYIIWDGHNILIGISAKVWEAIGMVPGFRRKNMRGEGLNNFFHTFPKL